MQNYQQKKENLIAQLKQLHAKNKPIVLNKDTSNLFRGLREGRDGLDVRQFNQVIEVDLPNLTVNVEGMTTYERLCEACLKYHCLPCVVPQLKTITVGGALTGVGIESSSFKYGLMHETVSAFEVLLSNGSVVFCTPDNEHQDLFYAFPNSYGTLGYALRVELKVYPVKPYVKLIHKKFTDDKNYFYTFNKLCTEAQESGSFDFIDGVVFNKDAFYITTGKLVDEAPYLSDYTYKKIFYRSIPLREEDYLSIYDYIWRWDTDWFWCSKVFFAQNPLIRALLGKKRLNSAYYGKIRQFFAHNKLAQFFYRKMNKKWESVIQDVQIPIEKANDFLSFFENNIGIKPIWLCPTMHYNKGASFDLYPMEAEQLYINFGFWDKVIYDGKEGYYNRLIEKKVAALAGKKSLYSTSYYTKDEFAALYNQRVYMRLKNKYDPEKKFLTLYDKCCEKE